MDRAGTEPLPNEKFVVGSFLTHLAPSDRDYLVGMGARRVLPAGVVLFHEGDPTDHVLIVLSGWVRVYVTSPQGHVTLLALRGPGEILGDAEAVNSGWARVATAETLQEVAYAQLSRDTFTACLARRPAIAVALLKNAYSHERESALARLHFASFDVPQRVAAFLVRIADMHGRSGPTGVTMDMPLTQQDVADFIGASRRTVARALASLRDRRIISTGRSRITINQLEVLRFFAETA